MGLATIDPYSHRVQTKLYKIAKFGVNRPNSKQHAAIKKTYKEMCMAIRMLSEHSVRVAIHISLYTNFDILKLLYPAYYWVYLPPNLGIFVNLGVLFLTMWINTRAKRLRMRKVSIFKISVANANFTTRTLFFELKSNFISIQNFKAGNVKPPGMHWSKDF